MTIFGVPIEGLDQTDILSKLRQKQAPLWVVTANPEILLEARRDGAYKQAILQADVRLVDGVGLRWIGKLFGQSWTRVTGVDLSEALIKEAQAQDWRIALIGGKKRIAELAASHWRTIYPGLSIIGEEGGSVSSNGTDDEAGDEARHRLTMFEPQIVLVAFGHPKQERWIARYLQDMPGLRVIVGVGGTFDYWAGHIRRAPKFMRAIGLEWGWRLIQEPKRIGRILKAVIVFPVLAVWDHWMK